MAETNLKKRLSPKEIVIELSATIRRFPLAVVCIAGLAVHTLFVIHGIAAYKIDDRLWIALGFALTSSVAVTLALEERWSKIRTVLAGVAVAALWGVRCMFFPIPADMTDAQWVEAGVMCGASFFAVFFVSYLRRDTDAQWWNFSLRTLTRLLLGGIFSGILFVGLLLAIHAVGELFDFNLPEEIFGWLGVACFIVFAPLYVLAGVPGGEDKRDSDLHPEHLLKVLALYILVPILAVYTLILYVYLAKIVITWELPNGWVSWLVSTLALGGLVVTLLLYPHRMKSENRVIDFLSRRAGVMIAPLLVLMTVGIARRISDYGWTPNRAYILLLNLWFYAIYLWLWLVRGRRVKWILISAVMVALLSSVGPWSLAKIEPRPDDGSALSAAQEEEGEWFSSDSTFTGNTPLAFPAGYDSFASIRWNGSDNTDRPISLVEEGGDLIITVNGEEKEAAREFRISWREISANREIRGDGFVLLVNECYGTRYPKQDSLDVGFFDGFLFY